MTPEHCHKDGFMQQPLELRTMVMLDPGEPRGCLLDAGIRGADEMLAEGSFKLVMSKMQSASKRNEILSHMEEADASTIKFLCRFECSSPVENDGADLTHGNLHLQ